MGSLRLTLIAIALGAGMPATNSASAKQSMSLASADKDSVASVEVDCDEVSGTEYDCVIGGTHITNNVSKLEGYGNIANPEGGKCFVEVGISHAKYVLSEGGLLISREGPGGHCGTTIVEIIDFKQHTYSFRTLHEQKSGICGKLLDTTTFYTNDAFTHSSYNMNCSKFETVPSLWMP